MIPPLYQVFRACVTTLTPLHIGTGKTLLLDYDFAIHNRSTYRLNEAALLADRRVEDPLILQQLMHTPPGQLLNDSDFTGRPDFFRYVIGGLPRAQGPGSQLREQIKTPGDEPYLPGSSLKGALRTALAWQGFADFRFRANRQMIDERNAKFAARPLEQALFGADPNHDLFRAVQVSDSRPVGADRLILLNARVLTRNPKNAPIELEGIRPETVFELLIKLDWQLFSEWSARRDFHLGGNKDWLENLASIMNAHAFQRIHSQRAWYAGAQNAARLVGFYAQMEQLKLQPNQFVAQIGWGGGWDSKTLGSRLQTDKQFFEWMLSQPRLKLLKPNVRRTPGTPFPNSRRVVMLRQKGSGGQAAEIPAAPLGWVMVELKEE